MKTISILIILYIFLTAGFSHAQETKKVIHQAMEQEIARNLSGLHLDGMKNPFYIGSSIVDINMFVFYSALGSMIRTSEAPNRIAVNNQVLVGDYTNNNLNFSDSRALFYPIRTMAILPLENSPQEIQNRLWIAFDRAYKLSAEIYESKQSALKSKTQEEGVTGIPDFQEGVKVLIDKPEISLKVNKQALIDYSKEVSSAFKSYNHLIGSWVRIVGYKANVYHSNSEGTRATYPVSVMRISVFAKTQLPDGEIVELYKYYHALNEEGLPDKEVVKKEIRELSETLLAFHTAPVFDDIYTGPVLFEGQAAGEAIRKTMFYPRNENLSAVRKAVKGNTSGPSQAAGEVSSELRIDKKIAPEGFSVIDKPLMSDFGGIPLIGCYPVDIEGTVPKTETVLVENGILKGLLSGRIPTGKIKESNGHYRISIPALQPIVVPGVVVVDYNAALPLEDLKKKLVESAKEEGLTYALIVREMTPNQSELKKVFKVDVNTGEETFIRSASFKGLTINDLRKLVGAGNKKLVINTTAGADLQHDADYLNGCPATFITPDALLFKEIEVTKNNRPNMAKLPVVKNPMEL